MSLSSFLTFEYPTDHFIPHFSPKKVISHDHLLAHIAEQITPLMRSITLNEMELRKMRLKDKPLVSYLTLSDILPSVNSQPEFSWVLLNNIIAKPYEDELGWASEPIDEPGTIQEIAKNFVDHADDAGTIEEMFSERNPEKRIKIVEIMGPAGPFYYVASGIKKVAACIIAGFTEIPCDVVRIIYPLSVKIEHPEQEHDWKKKISLGLIKGTFETRHLGPDMEELYLTITSESLQWVRASSPSNFSRINRAYEQIYPESLQNLMIPRRALFDAGILWKYLQDGF